MFLSVIVPIYNGQAYLRQCLDSLLDQDIPAREYEIVCVNDGSRDGSGEILREYGDRFSNVIVIEQENAGVAAARNTGLKQARGAYVWFVDADDFVQHNILGKMRATVEAENCDRLVFGAYQFADELAPEEVNLASTGGLSVNAPWYDAVVWRSLLKRSFLEENQLFFRYPQITHGEDGLFMYEVARCQKSCVEMGEILYFYRVHSGSAETERSPEHLRKMLRSHMAVTKILADYYAGGSKDSMTANKLTAFLWNTLYEITQLPSKERRNALRDLAQQGLFPYQRPAACTMLCSYVTDRNDWIGKGFDWLYRHLHTRWGFALMTVLQQLRRLAANVRR